jgi:hypothetical protein
MKKYYFTFGFGHEFPNCYTVIEAEDAGAARKEMFSRYGDKWAMQYDTAEAAGVDRFNLTRVQMVNLSGKEIERYDGRGISHRTGG